MKSYIKTHKNAKALSKHKTKLQSRGAKITVTGMTILYSFPSKDKSLPQNTLKAQNRFLADQRLRERIGGFKQ